MDQVAATGREIVITKRGRPVARLVPFRPALGSWFGRDRDIIKIHGDIGAPIDVEWEAEVDPDRVLNPLSLPDSQRRSVVDGARATDEAVA